MRRTFAICIAVSALSAFGCAGRYADDKAVNAGRLNGLDKPSGTGGTLISPGQRLPAGVVEVKCEDAGTRLDAAGIVRAMLERWKDVRDYTAHMEKQEWMGGGVEPDVHCILERTRLNPKSLHFQWIGERNKGRHALWVDGRDGGRMLVHPNPILRFGTLKIAPDSIFAKGESNYDFRAGGMQGIMIELPDTLRENGTVWTYAGEGAVYGRPVWRLTAVDPTTDPAKHNRMELHVDQQTLLPLFFEGKTREGRLNIWVKFKDVKINVGLTDADFDPAKIW